MSLILEALKKSERQRRLGESPSIGSPIMVVRRRRSLLPALVVLIAIGLAALWWLRREPATEETGENSPTSIQKTAATPAVPAATAPRAPTPAPRPEQKKVVAQAPASDGRAAEREKIRSGERVVANPQAGAAATVRESAAVSAADPAAIAAAMTDAAKPPITPERKDPEVKAPVARAPGGEASNAPAAPATSADTGLKLFWELPLASRRSLPEIKLSMHVFAVEPRQRFVIINGERRAEGDDFDGLKLIEIRSDGVVLEHEGVRFLYPRGGR